MFYLALAGLQSDVEACKLFKESDFYCSAHLCCDKVQQTLSVMMTIPAHATSLI